MNEGRPILSAAKCRSMILVSINIGPRVVRIFTGVPYSYRQRAPPNDSGVLENGDAQTFPSKFQTLKPTLLYSNTQSLVGFSVIPKCVTLNDL